MKRFASIPNRFAENKLVDYKHIDTHDDCRIVDDSSYVSNKRADQILAKQFASELLDKLAFDDPADIKSGAVNVYARQKGRDIAELTQQMRMLEAKAEKALLQDIERLNQSDKPVPEPAPAPAPTSTPQKD